MDTCMYVRCCVCYSDNLHRLKSAVNLSDKHTCLEALLLRLKKVFITENRTLSAADNGNAVH